MNSSPEPRQMSDDKGGRDGGESNDDIDILRKEYRNMQANRNAFAHESDLVLRRQQATLDKLRAENETLKADVARIQTRHMTRPINSFEQSQLDRLYQELDRYSGLVESEKAKAVATEKEISALRDEIWKRRQQMGGVNAAANNQRIVEKQVRLLESQLDQALVKFNKCVSRNKRLREEIDGLRGERVTFEKVYRKVEMDLREKKKHMAVVIEQSNQAYEQRDKAQLEIAAIERLSRKEEDAYHQQISDLSGELEKVNEQLLNSTKSGQTAIVVDPLEEERKVTERKDAARATELARAEEEYAQQRDKKLKSYEDAFREISAATGISDVDKLVKVFIENEEHNFSLFRYSSEQAAEIERLEEDIQSLREEEMKYKNEASDDRDGSRRDDIVKLQNEISLLDELTKAYESKCDSYQNILEEVKDEIKLLLIRLNCKFDEELTTDNILHYLGILEERALEIISNYLKTKEFSNGDRANSMPLDKSTGGRVAMGAAAPISVNAPRLLDYSSDDSGDEGGESWMKPIHRSDMNYSKIASIVPKRKTIPGRRGSIFGLQPRRRTNISAAPDGML
ncbi:hypothetical protein ACHAW5_008281 [Stephanodiscus triporus]|uniref:ODAD1 central coiled coil region domain-containing protein n=1 Tax=Stephanodiscus triporus TaxID=2934178 RepID=A0ABD3MP12_9STRA